MFLKIKNRLEYELKLYIRDINKLYSLSRISPPLFSHIREFISRKGKRIRPILFVIGYLGYAKRIAPGLYRSALSMELLHDFMLVHDDIIDRSSSRRGRPSMHAMLNDYLGRMPNVKFSGEDLTIVIGDVLYAMALHAFLSIKEEPRRKEEALKKLITAALFTGSGEFLELIYSVTDTGKIKKDSIYKIYDLKTANYTFASPLAIGATLAGAKKSETEKIFRYGICLGRAFQIQDDILGMFGEEEKIGKSVLTDLQEAKKTVLIWYAFKKSNPADKKVMRGIFLKKHVDEEDLQRMRKILSSSGALDYARNQISLMLKQAKTLSSSLRIKPLYKNSLDRFSEEMLSL